PKPIVSFLGPRDGRPRAARPLRAHGRTHPQSRNRISPPCTMWGPAGFCTTKYLLPASNRFCSTPRARWEMRRRRAYRDHKPPAHPAETLTDNYRLRAPPDWSTDENSAAAVWG